MDRPDIIVRAGNVYRLSDILHQWKREWMVIYLSGLMKTFKSQDKTDHEKKFNLTYECKRVLHSTECTHEPPEGKEKKLLFGFKTDDSNHWFCAESADDSMAWSLAIEPYVGNVIRRPTRPSSTPVYTANPYYNGYNYQNNPVMYGNQGNMVVPQTIIQHPDGSQTVYVNNNSVPYCYRHGTAYNQCHSCHYYDSGSGAALGFAAGALLMTPLLWGPWLWI